MRIMIYCSCRFADTSVFSGVTCVTRLLHTCLLTPAQYQPSHNGQLTYPRIYSYDSSSLEGILDLTHALVATAARAAATGLVRMSTRPDPEGSGTGEIATRRCPRLRVVWDLRELTH